MLELARSSLLARLCTEHCGTKGDRMRGLGLLPAKATEGKGSRCQGCGRTPMSLNLGRSGSPYTSTSFLVECAN